MNSCIIMWTHIHVFINNEYSRDVVVVIGEYDKLGIFLLQAENFYYKYYSSVNVLSLKIIIIYLFVLT